MTTLGKVFVFVQFILSMLLVSIIGIGIYPHRVNPKNEQVTAAGDKLPSTLQKLDSRITELGAARDRAEHRWSVAWQDLQTKEGRRPARQKSYADKLELTRNNPGREASPVRAIVYDPTYGMVNIKAGAPIQHRGEDTKSYREIGETLDNFHKNQPKGDGGVVLGFIPKAQADIKAQLAEHDRLTIAILGDPPGTGGLRRQRELQEEAKKRAVVEQENLKPALANRYSEALLALKRQISLASRKQELEKIGVAIGETPPK